MHYACPLLAAAGYAVFGFATRYLNNDTDCLHELAARDVAAAVEWVRGRGAEAVVLFGNSGGGSLSALAHAEHGCGDAWIGVAAHPGEGEFMLQSIDPSVADEHDPSSVVPELDMYDPANGWRPWPEPSSYDPEWLGALPRRAARTRGAHRRHAAREQLDDAAAAPDGLRGVERGSDDWRRLRKRAVHLEYFTIYRTLAEPDVSRPEHRSRRPAARFVVRVPRPVRRQLRLGRPGAHDDVAGLVVDVVGAVVDRPASRRRCPTCTCRCSSCTRPPTPRSAIRQAREIADSGRLRRRHLRRDEGRAALPRRPPPRSDADRRRLDRQTLPVSPNVPSWQ